MNGFKGVYAQEKRGKKYLTEPETGQESMQCPASYYC